MSAVDVLARLREMTRLWSEPTIPEIASINEVRDAVAELIEAAGQVWESEEGAGETDRPQYARLRAALVRCGAFR